jgi:hypothetical protein
MCRRRSQPCSGIGFMGRLLHRAASQRHRPTPPSRPGWSMQSRLAGRSSQIRTCRIGWWGVDEVCEWVRFVMPLIAMWFVICTGALIIGVSINLRPF